MSIQDIYERYHEEIQFLNIYIREAHPIDGWWLGRRLTKGIIKRLCPYPKASMAHYDPKTIEERRAVAGECQAALEYGLHTYVEDPVELIELVGSGDIDAGAHAAIALANERGGRDNITAIIIEALE